MECAQHERLEFSVLRRIPLILEYRAAAETVRARVLPLDVRTRDGAEWLKFSDESGATAEIRLDSIVAFDEAPRQPT